MNLLDFQDCKNNNSHLLHLQHAALQYMTQKKLFEYIREKCEIYQHLQVRGRDLYVYQENVFCLGRGYIYGDCCRKNSPFAIFTPRH